MLRIGLAIVACTAALVLPSASSASSSLLFGLFDDSETFGNTSEAFARYQELQAQVLRITVRWDQVAPTRPAKASDPLDPAYAWEAVDDVAIQANGRGIELVATIVGAPAWTNRGKGPTSVPSRARDLRRFSRQLRKFARAAARRYSGTESTQYAGLPLVSRWTAWNEPNLPTFLKTQYVRKKTKSGKRRFVRRSPVIYASICNAVYRGVHQAGTELGIGEQVACGVTAPGGNNNPRSSRPTISPLLFLRDLKRAGAVFDAYAHHPYPGSPLEKPTDRPRASTRISLGSIWRLIRQIDRLYGKDVPIWITEYGYQTNPPDSVFGVSRKNQAKYLGQAYAIARANPRIEMLNWFLLRDEPIPAEGSTGGWQSGLLTVDGKPKKSFRTYKSLAGG
ncbi:MAG: glycosyl hydrolase [Gaiellales bacterium]